MHLSLCKALLKIQWTSICYFISHYKHCRRTYNVVLLFSLFPPSVQFSCSVMYYSLRPHELQHARPPCPSPTPGVYPNLCPLSWWCHLTISSSCPLLLLPSVFSSIYFWMTLNWCYWMLGAGALGQPRGRVWGGRREEGSGWGARVYLWQIHFDVWQN